MMRDKTCQQASGGTAFLRIVLWTLLGVACELGIGATAAAQTLKGGVQKTDSPPPAEVPGTTGTIVAPAPPAPDLQKYLLPGGRFIDHCSYWHDHPDADTQRYGWPDHFPPGGTMGETRSFNGQPAPYVRCAIDPCAPYGYICWRNPAAQEPPPAPNAAAYDLLRQKGCTVGPGGQITCPAPHPGPPSDARIPGGYDPCQNPIRPASCPGQAQLAASAPTNRCHLAPNGGLECDTSSSGGAPGLSGSADSHGDVPNTNGGTTEGTGTQANGDPDGGVPYVPLPQGGRPLTGKAEVQNPLPSGAPLPSGTAKTTNPELTGTTEMFGPTLTIKIGEGWQENHEAKGQIPANKDSRGRPMPNYYGEAEGTVAIKKDSQGTIIKDQYGNPTYYFNLRHLTVRTTGKELIDPSKPVEIYMQSVFKGY
jgi:hypothetical protein